MWLVIYIHYRQGVLPLTHLAHLVTHFGAALSQLILLRPHCV